VAVDPREARLWSWTRKLSQKIYTSYPFKNEIKSPGNLTIWLKVQ
jgi:hypothetical protein